MKNARTIAHLARLKPEFAALLDAMLELGYRNEMNPQISCSIRTPQEQDAEHAKGRTILKTLEGKAQAIVTNARRFQSLHQYGIAADLFFLVNGKADFEDSKFRTLWNLACKAGLDRKGLEWSGLWSGSLREGAHFQFGKPSWRELATDASIDPITLNPIKS